MSDIKPLTQRFEFENFAQALAFVNQVGELAEEENHHPDICFGWGYVEVKLFTHSEDTVTDKDRKLMSAIKSLHTAD